MWTVISPYTGLETGRQIRVTLTLLLAPMALPLTPTSLGRSQEAWASNVNDGDTGLRDLVLGGWRVGGVKQTKEMLMAMLGINRG